MFLKYVGPHDEVEVPDARLTVRKNQTIEVSAELADGLLCQEDNWKKTTPTKSAPTAEEEE
jgi:hypothetical protein